MTDTAAPESSALDALTLLVHQQIDIAAPAEKAFAALLHQLGPGMVMPDGTSMKMVVEPRPGGRWFRDTSGVSGDIEAGHLWGFVQVIKPPKLIEFTGPMFMSYAAINHIQFRLTEEDGKTVATLQHQALGVIDEEHRKGVTEGWLHMLQGVKQHAEQ